METIERTEAEPDAPAPAGVARAAGAVLTAGVLGVAAGALAKVADEALGGADIGTDYGVWIVLVTAVGAFAPGPLQAALRSTAFMAAAMTAYYVVQAWRFGFFSQNLYAAWLLLSLTAVPVWGAAMAYARGRGWLAALVVSAPVGLLLSELWGDRHHLDLHVETPIFDAVAAVVFTLLLPQSWSTRLRVVVLAVPAAIVAGAALEVLTRFVPSS